MRARRRAPDVAGTGVRRFRLGTMGDRRGDPTRATALRSGGGVGGDRDRRGRDRGLGHRARVVDESQSAARIALGAASRRARRRRPVGRSAARRHRAARGAQRRARRRPEPPIRRSRRPSCAANRSRPGPSSAASATAGSTPEYCNGSRARAAVVAERRARRFVTTRLGPRRRPTGSSVGRPSCRRSRRRSKRRATACRRSCSSSETPGIGKSRMLDEFTPHAIARGVQLLFGACQEDVGIPYLPVASVRRARLRAQPVRRPAAGRDRQRRRRRCPPRAVPRRDARSSTRPPNGSRCS